MRTHRWMDACVASHRVAPNASSCSILSLPAQSAAGITLTPHTEAWG